MHCSGVASQRHLTHPVLLPLLRRIKRTAAAATGCSSRGRGWVDITIVGVVINSKVRATVRVIEELVHNNRMVAMPARQPTRRTILPIRQWHPDQRAHASAARRATEAAYDSLRLLRLRLLLWLLGVGG